MKIFLFDFDGVIIDTLPIAVEAYNSLLKKYQIKHQFTHKTFTDLFLTNFHEGFAKVVTDEKAREKILKERAEEYIKRKDDFTIFDGIEDALQLLSEKNRIIIISSNRTNFIQEFLLSRKIKGVSEVLGGDIEKSKEKKINWQKEKYPKSQIYYIGDTIGDIKEGKRNKIITVGVTWGFHSRELMKREKPDFLFNHPKDLIKLISAYSSENKL